MNKIIYIMDIDDFLKFSRIKKELEEGIVLLSKGAITNIIEIDENNHIIREISLK